uniref:Uncharacterized protein n=1 Tax=Rhizophora mucronata TaxID=61149 RepID=A0A2P2LFK1_RHIMU
MNGINTQSKVMLVPNWKAM